MLASRRGLSQPVTPSPSADPQGGLLETAMPLRLGHGPFFLACLLGGLCSSGDFRKLWL